MSTTLRRTWLPFLNEDVPETCDTPAKVAAHELKLGCAALGIGSPKLAVEPSMGEGYAIKDDTITGGSVGILYGVYAFLFEKAAGEPVPEGTQSPFWRLRMLNSWDNADGSVERGYSGRSLWFEGGELRWDGPRIRQLGRMLASAGINVLCVNNVNVRSDAARLIEDKLPDLARLADAFRPFGVRLMVSIEFSRPLAHGVGTADPLDAKVQAWWAERANAVWAAIPDLAGFLVKADSEHRPGPFTYGRTHAEGANMLARAIAPHGGTLVWRAFVYNCQQDWRDTATDRPKAACETYAPLDGQFDENVLLQVKNGPFDFQVREPVSPTFYAMPNTNLAADRHLRHESHVAGDRRGSAAEDGLGHRGGVQPGPGRQLHRPSLCRREPLRLRALRLGPLRGPGGGAQDLGAADLPAAHGPGGRAGGAADEQPGRLREVTAGASTRSTPRTWAWTGW